MYNPPPSRRADYSRPPPLLRKQGICCPLLSVVNVAPKIISSALQFPTNGRARHALPSVSGAFLFRPFRLTIRCRRFSPPTASNAFVATADAHFQISLPKNASDAQRCTLIVISSFPNAAVRLIFPPEQLILIRHTPQR